MFLHRRRLAALIVVPALLACAAMLSRPHPSGAKAATLHDPIVFVHGWNGSASNWYTMVSRFKADGWTDAELNTWSYNSAQSNVTTAQQLSTKIDQVLSQTGASKVDIISHSMGGLSSRYYAKNLGGDAKIDQWVSLAGPNHGTDSANACFDTSCVEMRIGSTFLTALNSGDETPGTPAYATWWSPCDETINPDSSVALSGAKNTKTGCIGHIAFLTDATVYSQVRSFVAP